MIFGEGIVQHKQSLNLKAMKKIKILALISALMINGIASADLNTGLIAHYSFDNNTDDETGNGNNGIQYGGITYIDGVIGKAARFDGVDDFIRITSRSNVSSIGDFSISVWTYLVDLNNHSGYKFDRQYIFDRHSHSSTVISDFYRPGFDLFYDGYNSIQEIHDFIMYTSPKYSYLEQNTSFAVKGKWLHHVFIK